MYERERERERERQREWVRERERQTERKRERNYPTHVSGLVQCPLFVNIFLFFPYRFVVRSICINLFSLNIINQFPIELFSFYYTTISIRFTYLGSLSVLVFIILVVCKIYFFLLGMNFKDL